MAHFMFRWRLRDEAVSGLVRNPQDRTAPARQMIASFGGRMLSFFYTFGEFDGFAICEMPDEHAAVALAMASRATQRFEDFQMLTLFTPEEAERMMQRAHTADPSYVPPGNYVP
ncbi:MAG TPA: GYD domain-containing protein [Acetobacteraceae bacterium]|jgi:uncharacterized protein with GYD domain|nr:GYD domain-containing protein [Acetobacteraceae bacterium]